MKNKETLEEPKLSNICIKCGVDLYYAPDFICQEHPKNCKGIHLSKETLQEWASKKEEPKQDLEKEMFELEQELDIPSHLRWHNSKPKQETLEEAAMKMYPIKKDPSGYDINMFSRYGFYNGAKWQQEQDKNKYSEEEVYIILEKFRNLPLIQFQEWFEQFKNK